jgi:hypothetical protein
MDSHSESRRGMIDVVVFVRFIGISMKPNEPCRPRVTESGCSASAGFWAHRGLVQGHAFPTRMLLLQCACSPSALSLDVANQVAFATAERQSIDDTHAPTPCSSSWMTSTSHASRPNAQHCYLTVRSWYVLGSGPTRASKAMKGSVAATAHAMLRAFC